MDIRGMSFMSVMVERVKERPYLVAVPLIIVAAAWFFFFRNADSATQTMAIKRADFSQVVSVSGSVKAAHTVDLAFEESGRVGGVYVSVGDTVPAGKTLAAIEGADAAANVDAKQAALESAQAQLESLKAGARPEDIQVAQAQANKAHQDLANLYASVPPSLADAYAKASDAVYTQLALFFSNADSLSPKLTFSTSASQAVTDAETKRVQAGLELQKWQRELSGISGSSATSTLQASLVSAQTHLAMIADFLASVSTVANAAITLPNGISTTAALKANVSAALSETSAARSSITSTMSGIASQGILAQQLDAQLALTVAGPKQQDIDAQAAQVAVAQAQLADAKAQVAKTLIVAPFSGLVTDVNAKVGQIVSPNTPEISMISSGTFQIETYIPEVNIANVRVGQAASVTLDAYGDSVVFDATIVSIDPAETMLDGVPTYKATLQFAAADPRIRSGMTAAIKIKTADVPAAIAIPLGAIYQKNGVSYVQVQGPDDAVQERAVTLDKVSALGSVVVTSGLSEGDVLILDPAH